MVGHISRGPTPTASKARPSSFHLRNHSSTPYHRTTSDSSSYPDYLDKQLRLARLKTLFVVIHRPPPRGAVTPQVFN
jgi:hypothetical protein